MSNGDNRSWSVYPKNLHYTNAPECIPNLGPPDAFARLLSNIQALGVVVHSQPEGTSTFCWSGSWLQLGGGNPYHSYVVNVTVPAGVMAVLCWAGFDNITDAVYDLFVDGVPHPILNNVGNYTSVYDEVNPPGAATVTNKGNCLGLTDAGVTGITMSMDFKPTGLVFPSGVNVGLRHRVHVAAKQTSSVLYGYFASAAKS